MCVSRGSDKPLFEGAVGTGENDSSITIGLQELGRDGQSRSEVPPGAPARKEVTITFCHERSIADEMTKAKCLMSKEIRNLNDETG
jgi:hypothetical protein